MHSLKGTFVEERPAELDENKNKMWPVKIMIPPAFSRILYFESKNE